MPSVTIYPPDLDRKRFDQGVENPLPQLLQTPSGLAILEIQGTINMPSSDQSSSNDNDISPSSTPIGRIAFPDYHKDDPSESTAWMKRVHLYVGRYQRLIGEVKKLNKPLALIRKRSTTLVGDAEDLEIADIVYYKILFSSRPEPVGN